MALPFRSPIINTIWERSIRENFKHENSSLWICKASLLVGWWLTSTSSLCTLECVWPSKHTSNLSKKVMAWEDSTLLHWSMCLFQKFDIQINVPGWCTAAGVWIYWHYSLFTRWNLCPLVRYYGITLEDTKGGQSWQRLHGKHFVVALVQSWPNFKPSYEVKPQPDIHSLKWVE